MSIPGPEVSGEVHIQRIEQEMMMHRERYAEFRGDTEPLTPMLLEDIMGTDAIDMMTSENFALILEKIDWPNEGDEEVGGKLDCAVEHNGPGTFTRAALSDKGLNNFHACLQQKPHLLHVGPEQITDIAHFAYATKPCLIRARAVALELFDALRELERSELSEGLRIPTVKGGISHNETVMEAYATAYSLMQRLMMPSDMEAQYRLLNQATDATSPIGDATAELWM